MTDTRYFSDDDDRTTLALAAGLVAALLGGAGWAAIVLLTDTEIGWAAWGIGVLVGIAMAMTTQRRSRGLALAAATLAVLGLLAGKAFVVAGSTGKVANELMESPEYLEGAMAWRLYGADQLDPATMEAVAATHAAGDTLSDAIWADMRAEAAVRLAAMTEEARREVARDAASGFIQQLGMVDGVLAQLSGFDLLWMLLAVGTAFQMMDAGAREAAVAVAEPEPEPEKVEPLA